MSQYRTWQEMVRLEPRLKDLYDEARTIKDEGGRYFCANEVWFTEFKPVLRHLVGWWSKKPDLRSSQAYDSAYQKIYQTLPGCRNCGCL